MKSRVRLPSPSAFFQLRDDPQLFNLMFNLNGKQRLSLEFTNAVLRAFNHWVNFLWHNFPKTWFFLFIFPFLPLFPFLPISLRFPFYFPPFHFSLSFFLPYLFLPFIIVSFFSSLPCHPILLPLPFLSSSLTPPFLSPPFLQNLSPLFLTLSSLSYPLLSFWPSPLFLSLSSLSYPLLSFLPSPLLPLLSTPYFSPSENLPGIIMLLKTLTTLFAF